MLRQAATGRQSTLTPMAKERVGVARSRPFVLPALLLALSVLQSPGRVTFDTDLDLSLNPSHLMHRALHLWSARSGFGGVGDQTYGFLFPMGPFFAVGHLLQVPDWLVQRLWAGAVLVVAYEGMRRLVRALVSPAPPVGVLAGLAWALSPRMLTVIGPFSAEALPVALLPWILLPLVVFLPHDPRRAAWWSGLGVLCLGAVNATASLAVLPVPLLYLLTRKAPWRALGWWLLAVVLATAWWIGPLLLLGAYSPPFIDWVESARTTTDPVGVFATLRGATDWVAYVPAGQHGYWPGAWQLATTSALVAATLAVAVVGLVGLTSRRLPERRFLLLTAVLGFAVLTIGHAGSPGSPVAAEARDLLDGVLAPFRNIYKFDAVLRFPLVLGLAHVAHRVLPSSFRRVGAGVLAALVLVAAWPAWTGSLRPGPGFSEVPSWWTAAAAAMATDGVAGRTLVVPEATTGRYTWGRTIGEPLEALARSPWAVRDQVPLTQAGNTRLVDAIETVLASGRGSPVLADVLARSGVGQLLVRNDLDRGAADALPPVRVRAALERSPGLRLLRSFGPPQQVVSKVHGATVDGGIDTAPAALEVWVVDRQVSGPHSAPLTDAVGISGGPEDLIALLEAGVVGATQPTLIGPAAPGKAAVVTDGLQRRERSFGRVHDVFGPLLTAGERYRQTRAAHDLLPFPAEGLQPVAAYDGLTGVTASSSAAYPDNFGGAHLQAQPGNALDGNPLTAWSTGGLTRPIGQWLQVVRASPSAASSVGLRLLARPEFGPVITSLRIDTDAGSVVRQVAANEEAQILQLPAGAWSRLRLTVTGIKGPNRIGVVGIREVALPGAPPTRTVVVPAAADNSLLFRAPEGVEPCLQLAGVQRCDAASGAPSEEAGALDRSFTLATGAELELAGTVLPGQGLGVARLLTPFGDVLVGTASSSLDGGELVGGSAAVDGDPATSWVANPGEPLPALGVAWQQPTTVSELVLVHADQPAASAPARVHVTSEQGERDATVGPGGVVRFAPLRTTALTLTFPEVVPRFTLSSRISFVGRLPVGVAEVRLPQVTAQPGPLPSSTPTGALCGFGPVVELDGTRLATQVTGTLADVRTSAPLRLQLCDPAGPVRLAAGPHRLRAVSTGEFTMRSLLLSPAAAVKASAAPRPLTVRSWGQVHRELDVTAGVASLLIVPEAANDGWVATLSGQRLAATTVDGWQQAWVVPAGAGGTVTLAYTPDGPYRLSLLLGAFAVVALLLLAAFSARRRVAPLPVVAVTSPWVVAPAALACGLAGGWVCLTSLVVGLVLVRLRLRLLVATSVWGLPLAAGAVVLLSGRSVVATQAGTAPQALGLLAIGALAALLTQADG